MIGLHPAEVKASSVWELSAAVEGWVSAHSPAKASASEMDEVWAWMQAKEAH